jgi:ADP-ribosylglycohydrolase/fructose-1,6-bisphosphatase/inositol monophosphatase family enzyme
MPSDVSLASALDVAVQAAREAGELLRRDFHRPGGARGHGDKAEADVEAEHAIRARLTAAFPRHSYLGEETGRVQGDPGAPLWLVDPNDGTRDYLVGRRGSTVSIGLLRDRRPVLGVVFAFGYPDDRGDLFAWAEGEGPLRRQGRPVEALLPSTLGPQDVVLVSAGGDRDAETYLRGIAPARYRAVCSIAHRLALVAAGEGAAAVSLFAPGAWDYAAGHALLLGAGGTLLNEDGQEVSYAEDGTSRCGFAFGATATVAARLAQHPWALHGADAAESAVFVRPRRGETVSDAGLLSRAQGCLLGQVAGDSLGSLVEFASAADVARRYPEGPRRLEDGGTWNTLAGQPTDDSELALALSRAILGPGRFDADAVLAAYRAWRESGPFDVGTTVGAALAGAPRPESQANGSLMRVSPLAVFTHGAGFDEAVALARVDSALTHPNPVCGDAVAAFVVAVRHALHEGDGPAAAHEAALRWAREAPAHPDVVRALEAARRGSPACDGESPGFVLIALQNAFHELLQAGSLEEGVVATVRRGGDTDTNAAIAGALLGAVYGRGAVPDQWRSMVLSCRPHPLRAPRPRPMAYWPVDLYEQAEALLTRAGGERKT